MRTRLLSRSLPVALALCLLATPASAITFTDGALTTGPGYRYLPSTDGKWVVWEEDPLLVIPPDTADRNVAAYDLSTGTRTVITDPSDDADQDQPRVSANRVVYVDHSEADTEIYLYDLETSVRTRITNDTAQDNGPDIDGNLIVWMQGVIQPITIRYYDTETATYGTVPGTHYPNGARVDRGRIVFFDDIDGGFDVWVYTPLTDDLYQVPNATTNTDIRNTVIHGDAVAFTRYPHTDSTAKDVWASDLMSGETGQVTYNLDEQQYPALFGKMLAWQDDRSGTDDIYIWNRPEGPGYDIVTSAAGNQLYPEMFGTRVAYEDHSTIYPQIGLSTAPQEATRISGTDRYLTAIAVSEEHFSASQSVVIATGENFPDALSASALAGALDAPLLLTRQAFCPTEVLDEIDRLGAESAYIVGGTSAISADAYDDIAAHVSGIQRVAGDNRYHTAERVGYMVVDIMNSSSPAGYTGEALIARGDNFPDALAVAPLAFARKAPIVLVQPDTLPVESARLLFFAPVKSGAVIGGTSAVSAAVKATVDTQLVTNGGSVTERWDGADRYATATEVAVNAIKNRWLDLDTIGIAVGSSFPDALGGGVALGHYGSPLILTRTDSIPEATRLFLSEGEYMFGGMQIFGGTNAIGASIETELEGYLQ